MEFYEDMWGRNFLNINKTDGSKICYRDIDSDLKVDAFTIQTGNNIAEYCRDSKNLVCHRVIEEGQKGFDNYISKIKAVQKHDQRE